jgi:hypothetical protein
MVVDAQTGERAEPMLVDKLSGRPMHPPEFAIAAGPAADERTKQRYARTHGDADRSSGADAENGPRKRTGQPKTSGKRSKVGVGS